MSKAKNYMVKAEAIARDALAKIQKANADLSAAEQCRKENRAPRTGMVDAEVMAKAARAEADYVEAKAAYEKCRRELPALPSVACQQFGGIYLWRWGTNTAPTRLPLMPTPWSDSNAVYCGVMSMCG